MAARSEVTFAEHVRDGLRLLHQPTLLARHPLARALGADGHRQSGLAVRDALVEAIEQLKPPETVPPSSPSWRRYRHLVLRYVEGRSFGDVLYQLNVSARQA